MKKPGIKKICTHPKPRHLDDFLAVAFLSYLFDVKNYEEVHPQNIPQNYKESPEIALIDVGNSYLPEVNNFDHHHDINLPCSLVLVLKNFSDDVDLNHPVITIIDYIDRFGFRRAQEKFQIPGVEEIDRMRRTMLFINPVENSKIITKAFFHSLEYSRSFNNFIKNMFKFLANSGVLDDAKEKVKQEEEEFFRKLKQIKVIVYQGLRVGYAPFQIRETNKVFRMLELDLLVTGGIFSEDETLIVKNDFSEKGKILNLSKLISVLPVTFIHKNGFLVVVKLPVQKVNLFSIIDDLVKTDCENKEVDHETL